MFSASGEAILGTLKCVYQRFLTYLFSASGEPILGPQRYFIKALYQSTLHKTFIQALYPSTLSKHFIKLFIQ